MAEFGTKSQVVADAGHRDQPIMIMLTCWELGGTPLELSFADPGAAMIAQNPGGLVAAVDTLQAEVSLETIRYALTRPTIRHLIVCGHTGCNTLRMLLEEDTKNAPNPFRDLIQSVKARVEATYADRSAGDWLGLVVQESVLQQLANLRSHADIRSRLEQGELLMHGWVRDDKTSTVSAYKPKSGQFDN